MSNKLWEVRIQIDKKVYVLAGNKGAARHRAIENILNTRKIVDTQEACVISSIGDDISCK